MYVLFKKMHEVKKKLKKNLFLKALGIKILKL